MNSNDLIYSLFKSYLVTSDETYAENKNSEDIIPVVNKNNYLFYIYNTHQGEEYEKDIINPYGVRANVVTASFMLQSELLNYGIDSIVEERNVLNIVRENGWDYPGTYTVTKNFVLEIKEKYPNIKYFIDIHRDGVDENVSYINIEGIDYARMMFTVGRNRDNLDINMNKVLYLKNYIDDNYPGLMRNVFYRDNDSFNEELDDNLFLIEVGGEYNTLTEIYNSMKVLAEAFNYMEENYEE